MSMPHLIMGVLEALAGNLYCRQDFIRLQGGFAGVLVLWSLEEFRSRYLLTYSPHNVDAGGWHRIEVRLTRRSGKVKARRGYER